jgi:hypothetical protein
LAIINNRLNEQLPVSETSASTGSYRGAGGTQRFIATDSLRIILPPNTVLENCVELSAVISGNETVQNLVTENITGIGNKQVLSLSSLGAAETRLFRFRAFSPTVSATPAVVALNNAKNEAHIASSDSTTAAQATEWHRQDFTVFPNPATESATLHFPPRGEGDIFTLTIADMYGNVIVRTDIWSQALVLPTRLLPSGVYFCSVQGKKWIWNTLLHVVK